MARAVPRRRIRWVLSLSALAVAEPAAAQSVLPPITVESAPQRARNIISAPVPTSRPATRRVARPVATKPSVRSRTAAASRVRSGPAAPVTPAFSAGTATPPQSGRGDLSPAVSALPANTTTLDAATIAKLPIFSYGDIFRPLTGFDVSNYGQGGIGNGIALRGFTDAEHGRDIAYFIDGVPVNEVSSIHTPNYADLNPLIPETVEKVEVIRGPFSVEYGDSNLGGAVVVTTKRSEPNGSVSLSGGNFDTIRGLGTYSRTDGDALPFLAFEGFGTRDDRQNSDVRRLNAFNKMSFPLEDGAVLSVRAQVYENVFNAPGYASRDLIEAGLRSERAPANFTDGGSKRLQNVVANYQAGTPDDEFSATLHASHSESRRYADYGGGQSGQEEDRSTFGGRVRKVWTTSLAGLPTQVLVGGNWRSDIIDVDAGPSLSRALTGYTTRLGVAEHDLAGFAQVQIKPAEWLKLTGGARFDQFFYDVSNLLDPALSPHVSPHATSPKAGVAVTPFRWLEVYANYGQGFRSPDAANELLANPALNPLKLESKEAGAQMRFERFSFLVDAYTTDINNEAYQPAPGLPVQNLGRSRREGMDFEAKLHAIKSDDGRVSLFANYGFVDARLLAVAPSRHVPSVPESVANVGAEFDLATLPGQRLSGTAYVSFIGRKFLAEDASIRTRPYQRVTARLAYAWDNGLSAFGQATWYPGNRLSEAAFNFGPNVGATSADVFVSPMPRLTALAGLRYGFSTGAQ